MAVGLLQWDPVAKQALEEIEGGCPMADALELEHLADTTDARARDLEDAGTLVPGLEAIARAVGVVVQVVDDLPAGVEGLLVGQTIYVRRRRDDARTRFAALHEIAHAAARGMFVSHADVLCLTLALGMARRLLRQLRAEARAYPWDVAKEALVPYWSAWARLRMPSALDR